MSINKSNLMTGGAVAFAVFAAWFVLRGPGRAAIAPTAGQKRANDLRGFLGVYDMQAANISTAAPGFYVPPINWTGAA